MRRGIPANDSTASFAFPPFVNPGFLCYNLNTKANEEGECMEMIKHPTSKADIELKVSRGHFATGHSHIN